jgi:hypothetical protein
MGWWGEVLVISAGRSRRQSVAIVALGGGKSRVRRVRLLVALISITTACTEVTYAPQPIVGDQFDPPPIFAAWWEKVESCSGRTESLASVAWYVVPGAMTVPDGSFGDVAAYSDFHDHRIVLAGEVQMLGPIVRHEMLHELLQADGHPRRAFLERCAGVVECISDCVDDAGPPPVPPASVPRVSGDSFDVNIRIDPESPGTDTLGGYFMVIVTARNRSHHAVVLRSPPPPDPLPPYTFGYIFGSAGPGFGFIDYAWDADAASFAAGETKQEIFDFAVGHQPGAEPIEPGTYQLRGAFEDHLTAPLTFVVSP